MTITIAGISAPLLPGQDLVNIIATSGATQTIADSWSSPFYTITDLTLSANCTLTFPAAKIGKSFSVIVRQPSSGGPFTVTYPTVTWLGGGVQISTAASSADIATFICTDGTNWLGTYAPEEVAAGWTNIGSFSNGWTNFGSGYVAARYLKDALGFVHLEGFIAPGTNNTTAFTLPAGYRPGYTLGLPAITGHPGVASVSISTAGDVTPNLLTVGDGDIGFSAVFLAEN